MSSNIHSDHPTNFFLTRRATIDVPINVALQYNHRLPITPEVMAGDNDRAGFIDAPDINAKKNMSRPTIPPMTSPPNHLNPLVYRQIPLLQRLIILRSVFQF